MSCPHDEFVCIECLDKMIEDQKKAIEQAVDKVVSCIIYVNHNNVNDVNKAKTELLYTIMGNIFLCQLRQSKLRGDCWCGAPLPHVPGGIHCRTPLAHMRDAPPPSRT